MSAANRGSRALKLGLVGAGNVAHWAYLPRFKTRESIRLTAVFDPDKGRMDPIAQAFGARACSSIDELVRDPEVDAVCICSPNTFHYEATLKVLEAGKHVLCEKPLSHRYDEAKRMYEAAQKAQTVNMVHFCYRFQAETRLFAKIVQSGTLGEIYNVWGTMSQGRWFTESGEPAGERPGATAWRFGANDGVVLDLGPHLVDFCRFAFGEIAEVQASCRSYRPGPPVCADDFAVTFKLQQGAMAHFLMSRRATGHQEHTFVEVAGSKGTLIYEEGAAKMGLKLWTREEPRWRELLVPASESLDFLEAFHDAILGGSKDPPTFWDGMKCNEAVEAALQSVQTRSPVTLPLAP